jgi:phytoene dehydrogenase-like protein
MGSVTDALAGAARAAGARMRTGCPVRRIVMDGLRVAGVELDDGEFIAGRAVVSGADPKTTLLDLLGARHLEAEAARRIHRLRTDGNTAKLHLALDGLPPFAGLPPDRLGERLLIAPSAHYVEQAFNHCKYREFSVRPVAEITIPSISDPGLAPAGKHVLSAIVQYAPRQLDGGWDEGRAAFTERVLDVLEDYAPGIRDRILATEMLSPEDLERVFRVRGGHWHHGELSLNQFLMLRPTPGLAQYRAPVTGLYLCSAGCHPGGGIIGSAGRNAARALLADGA